MERSDIIEMVRLGKHHMEKAEQARLRVVACHHRYDETMTKVDNLRRRMVFVEIEKPETLELVKNMMELEEIKEEMKGVENQLRIYITASLSYILYAVESLNLDSNYINSQITLVLRQAVMLIRSIRELNIDLSNVYAQAVKTRLWVKLTLNSENRMNNYNISRYINQLIISLE